MKRAIMNMARITIGHSYATGPQCNVNIKSSYLSQAVNFIIDSGSTHDVCHIREAFTNLKSDHTPVQVADGSVIYTDGIGRIGPFNDVYFIPDFKHNLLSVVKMNERGYMVLFDHPTCILIDKKTREELEIGKFVEGLYQSYLLCKQQTKTNALTNRAISYDHRLLHARCAHISDRIITTAVRSKMVSGVKASIKSESLHRGACEPCIYAKHTRTSSTRTPGSSHNTSHKSQSSSPESMEDLDTEALSSSLMPLAPTLRPLQKMCLDLKGPIRRTSISKAMYILICTCA